MYLLSVTCLLLAVPTTSGELVNGNWGEWINDAHVCNYPEIGCHYVSSSRSCDNPRPAFGGFECALTANANTRGMMESRGEDDNCHEHENCKPVNGGWSVWTTWTPCSAHCGEGDRKRSRICNSPSPAYGGQHCLLSTLRQTDTVYMTDREEVHEMCEAEEKCPDPTVYWSRTASITFLVLFLVFFIVFLILLCAVLCRNKYVFYQQSKRYNKK